MPYYTIHYYIIINQEVVLWHMQVNNDECYKTMLIIYSCIQINYVTHRIVVFTNWSRKCISGCQTKRASRPMAVIVTVLPPGGRIGTNTYCRTVVTPVNLIWTNSKTATIILARHYTVLVFQNVQRWLLVFLDLIIIKEIKRYIKTAKYMCV